VSAIFPEHNAAFQVAALLSGLLADLAPDERKRRLVDLGLYALAKGLPWVDTLSRSFDGRTRNV
jgi:hypothetical protein